ncbi:MAG: TIGR03086 family metal-binding protein [Kineosporiaceae bacterium]
MTDDLPLYPTDAPAVFRDPDATHALFDPVLRQLADVVTVPDGLLAAATPCPAYTVAELRGHVLGWLSFFAAALNDPDGTGVRPDPQVWTIPTGEDAAGIVERAAAGIESAIDAGVADRLVVMSQARMPGDGVLAMALGEYLVHGWDLAVATGAPWRGADDASDAARAFLVGMVTPEYRGEDSGFFGPEVPAPPSATAFERLLCFAGRDPSWQAPGSPRVLTGSEFRAGVR